jgi:E3 ubiquitin-protein ligase DOA10
LTVVVPGLVIILLSFIPGLNVLLWFVYVCIIGLVWWRLIEKIIEGCHVKTALRLEFNKSLDLGSFNLDDVLIFIKSNLYTMVTLVEDVFKEAGLPVDSLDAYRRSINNININTAGGAISMTGGSTIGVGNVSETTTSSVETK